MTTKEFVEKIRRDIELSNIVKTIKTREKMYELAKENGVTVDIDIFAKEFKQCIDSYKNISDEELKTIAAGDFLNPDPFQKASCKCHLT